MASFAIEDNISLPLQLDILLSSTTVNNPAMSQSLDMQAAAKLFFSQPTFAVAGASSNTAKFGYKIFDWYLQRGLNAIPLNPTCSTVLVGEQEYAAVSTIANLSDPTNTSLSVITPPAVTAQLLKEAKEAGIKAVWLQPGAFTDAELEYAIKEFPGGAVAGFAKGTRGGEGWCVLVDGDAALKAAATGSKAGSRNPKQTNL
ncbi:NAD(P)-binding protein [Acrodontium crateriforme]|uniref:NAD(P)-binding protein n=1 Tax=Acrodontium crateriforme TaxID=150365 RepID=A0AAQ3M0V4_9PEZI|nr:NAD(P)-binding protein [Acrodontium crateriforme]